MSRTLQGSDMGARVHQVRLAVQTSGVLRINEKAVECRYSAL